MMKHYGVIPVVVFDGDRYARAFIKQTRGRKLARLQ
jgi:hypothetical protein